MLTCEFCEEILGKPGDIVLELQKHWLCKLVTDYASHIGGETPYNLFEHCRVNHSRIILFTCKEEKHFRGREYLAASLCDTFSRAAVRAFPQKLMDAATISQSSPWHPTTQVAQKSLRMSAIRIFDDEKKRPVNVPVNPVAYLRHFKSNASRYCHF